MNWVRISPNELKKTRRVSSKRRQCSLCHIQREKKHREREGNMKQTYCGGSYKQHWKNDSFGCKKARFFYDANLKG